MVPYFNVIRRLLSKNDFRLRSGLYGVGQSNQLLTKNHEFNVDFKFFKCRLVSLTSLEQNYIFLIIQNQLKVTKN